MVWSNVAGVTSGLSRALGTAWAQAAARQSERLTTDLSMGLLEAFAGMQVLVQHLGRGLNIMEHDAQSLTLKAATGHYSGHCHPSRPAPVAGQ